MNHSSVGIVCVAAGFAWYLPVHAAVAASNVACLVSSGSTAGPDRRRPFMLLSNRTLPEGSVLSDPVWLSLRPFRFLNEPIVRHLRNNEPVALNF